MILAGTTWEKRTNAYLSGYAYEDGREVATKFTNLEEAKAECIRIDLKSNSVCKGITGRNTFTLRKNTEFKSSSTEDSWLRHDNCKHSYSREIMFFNSKTQY